MKKNQIIIYVLASGGGHLKTRNQSTPSFRAPTPCEVDQLHQYSIKLESKSSLAFGAATESNFQQLRRTCQPYCRRLPDDPLLECLKLTNDSSIQVHESHAETVKNAISGHRDAVSGGYNGPAGSYNFKMVLLIYYKNGRGHNFYRRQVGSFYVALKATS